MKNIVAIGIGLFVIALLAASAVQEALLSFIVAGAIPGTPFTVPPLLMIGGLGLALWLLIRWTRTRSFYTRVVSEYSSTPVTSPRTAASRKAAKRRFARQNN